ILTREDAYAVIRFFWHDPGMLPDAFTEADVNFAQGLLVEAIDATCAMGYVEIIFDNFFMKVPRDLNNLLGMLKKVAKAAAKHWWKHATDKDLADPKIYETVRVSLARNFRSTWDIRKATGELIY
ncbi:MAG: uncharacterized protein JWP04_2522, partial [Belnapia sp.]|nr:uncharacterized protein [Belnapia sp.]